MIKFKCVRCNAVVKAPETTVGKHVQCPTCQLKLTVPMRRTRSRSLPPLKPVAVGALLVVAFVALAWAVWPTRREKPAEGTRPSTPEAARDLERGQRLQAEERRKNEVAEILKRQDEQRKLIEEARKKEIEDRMRADEERRKQEERDRERFELEEKLRRQKEEIERRKNPNVYVE
ncbi:MAG TPA: hypothetical protein VMY39_09345 [Planctomycetota bacterium]|nr:hypothetical protein [Planctomycetota bacterium]